MRMASTTVHVIRMVGFYIMGGPFLGLRQTGVPMPGGAASLGLMLVAWMTACGEIHAGAEIIHVSPDGNDRHPGTVAQPLRSVTQAVKLLPDGGTCLLHAGRYRASVHVPRGSAVLLPKKNQIQLAIDYSRMVFSKQRWRRKEPLSRIGEQETHDEEDADTRM